jgi:hypothetical protein
MKPAARWAFLCLGLASAVLVANPSVATGEVVWTGSGCAPFSHNQTYREWGPARHYGRTVTVVYEAKACSTTTEGSIGVSMTGSAQVFPGGHAGGEALETRPFQVTGSWQGGNPAGWPPAWWACEVDRADYVWEIPGVYSFVVSARDGRWTLDVTTFGPGASAVDWTYQACG